MTKSGSAPSVSIYEIDRIREAIVQKIPKFYEIISQTGGGVNRISYLLFRNSKYPKISGKI